MLLLVLNRFTGRSADTMAEITGGFSPPNVDVATVNWRAAEMIVALCSQFPSGKAPDRHLITAGYLTVDCRE